jgi:hypothetical protein
MMVEGEAKKMNAREEDLIKAIELLDMKLSKKISN